jgi:hypothetical protein
MEAHGLLGSIVSDVAESGDLELLAAALELAAGVRPPGRTAAGRPPGRGGTPGHAQEGLEG